MRGDLPLRSEITAPAAPVPAAGAVIRECAAAHPAGGAAR